IESLEKPEAINASRMGFTQKVALLSALGLVGDDTVPAIEFVNSLRDKIAHNLDFEVAEKDIRDFVNCIPQKLQDTIKSEEEPVPLREYLQLIVFWTEMLRQQRAVRAILDKKGWMQVGVKLAKLKLTSKRLADDSDKTFKP